MHIFKYCHPDVMPKQCINCLISYNEKYNFCPGCGQKSNLHRLSIHEISHEAFHYFTHADKSIFRLLRELTVNTGKVAYEYVAGKRKSYFSPLNFYLIVATIFVLMISLVNYSDKKRDILNEHPEISRITDPVKKEQVIRIYERKYIVDGFMNKYSNIVAMIALPIIGLIYWLFYFKGRYNFAEHIAGCMYMAGYTNLCFAVIFRPLSRLLSNWTQYHTLIIMSLFAVFHICYNAVFYFRFINRRTKRAALKATLVSLFAVLFWFALSGTLIRIYISNGFWGMMK